MNLALFYVWEDARVWALWNHASDAHLSYLGQGPALPLLESPQGMADILYLLPWRAAFFIHNNWKSKSKVSAELIPPEDSQVALVVKKNKATCQCRRHKRRVCSVPGSGRSPGGGHSNPLQCSCLENPMDRGARWATVCGVAESDVTEAT